MGFVLTVLAVAVSIAVLERYGHTHDNRLSQTIAALIWWPLSIAIVGMLIMALAVGLWLVLVPLLTSVR